MEHLTSDIKYSHLTWNCPLSEDVAANLLSALQISPTTTVVDIGCGWGELLLRACLEYSPKAATGIDTDSSLLERARRTAAQRQISRASFQDMPGNQWAEVQHRAICIGSSHAFGSTEKMLQSLTDIVPSGRVLVGDMCWEAAPTEAAVEAFGDEVLLLKDIVSACQRLGWKIMHVSTANQRDWDLFESGHRAGPREWLLSHAGHAQAAELERQLNEREKGYFETYRGVLGFAYLVLAR